MNNLYIYHITTMVISANDTELHEYIMANIYKMRNHKPDGEMKGIITQIQNPQILAMPSFKQHNILYWAITKKKLDLAQLLFDPINKYVSELPKQNENTEEEQKILIAFDDSFQITYDYLLQAIIMENNFIFNKDKLLNLFVAFIKYYYQNDEVNTTFFNVVNRVCDNSKLKQILQTEFEKDVSLQNINIEEHCIPVQTKAQAHTSIEPKYHQTAIAHEGLTDGTLPDASEIAISTAYPEYNEFYIDADGIRRHVPYGGKTIKTGKNKTNNHKKYKKHKTSKNKTKNHKKYKPNKTNKKTK